MRLADTVATHPKFLKAGQLIGTPSGRAEALALYVAAVGYARHFMTDGRVPSDFISGCGLGADPERTAKVLASKAVRLWHPVPGGYRIHDFHDWNDNAREIKQKRQAEAARVRDYRKRSK
jgi:hypothetical protein